MAKKETNPLVTFVIYISRFNLPTHIDGFLSSLAYLKEKNEIQIIFVNASDDDEITSVINSYSNDFKIFYFKISSDLGQSYAYNLALPYIEGKYCHFVPPTYIIEPTYFDNIKKTDSTNAVSPDLIIHYNPHSLNKYELKNLIYKGLSKDLILGLYCDLKYFVINSEFLFNSEIKFQDFAFHPFTFVINLITSANLVAYIPTQLINLRFKVSKNFNVYDILYQAYDVLSLLNKKGIYEKYANEWNYLLIIDIYLIFLKVLAYSYNIDLNSKTSIKSQSQILSTAISSIKNIDNKLKLNVENNVYVKENEKSIFDIYNKIMKVIK